MPVQLEVGQVLAARYELLRRLAQGAASEVWLARDRASTTDCVLKFLAEDGSGEAEARERFMGIAGLQRELQHPNLLGCEEVFLEPRPFTVCPWLSRGDLRALRGRPWQELLPLLEGVAAGLAAVHERGLVHGDLKPANVLLGDDGRALISDFGAAAPVGSASAALPRSPFATSPQRMRGEPVSPADDVYAFGALAYELLAGYPPFYPQASRERVLSESVAPLADRVVLPPALERLVLRCLAKSTDERPADCLAILEELRNIKSDSAQETAPARVVPKAPVLQAPAETSAAIEPQWHRPATGGPSAEDLRRQGFRRGLVAAALIGLLAVAAFVFLGLPRLVENQAPVAASAPAPQAPAQPEAPAGSPDLAALAEQKSEFEELRAALGERLAQLEARSAQRWAGDELAAARRQLAAADAAAANRRYEDGLAALKAAGEQFDAIDRLAGTRLDEALAAGALALTEGRSADARASFELASQIDPSSATAQRGLKRAATLDEVLRLLAEGRAMEAEGRADAAVDLYEQALRLDPDTTAARESVARIRAEASNAEFARAVAQGLAALESGQLDAAREAFRRAERLRPGSAEARDGLAAIERAAGQASIEDHLAAARAAEQGERWSLALEEYRKALALDPRLLPAQQGVERAEPRAQLAAEIEVYLTRPERLSSGEVRAAARAALQRARTVSPGGPVLAGQITQLERLITAAETPVRVALSSDNATDVTIYRIGRLGAFERKDMELLPGRYTIVGSRSGFRDVRREIVVRAGGMPDTIVIRCEEPI